MELSIADTIKGVITSPSETFGKLKDAELSDILKFFLVPLAIYSVLSVAITALLMPAEPAESAAYLAGFLIGTLIILFISTIIGLFIGAAILHIFAYIFGARKGLVKTINAAALSMTPMLLLGWIPFVNIIASLWALVLEILALKEFQEMSTGRAAAAVLVPTIIMIILIFLAVIYFITVIQTSTYPVEMMQF